MENTIDPAVLLLNGATREGGNTDSLLSYIETGAYKIGVPVEQIYLRDCSFGQCIGCYYCNDYGECSQNDDMTLIRFKIQKASVLVFAAPIYWSDLPGLMKTFIDRLYFYYHSPSSHLIANKKVVIIHVMAEKEDIAFETELVNKFYQRMCRSLRLDMVDTLIFDKLYSASDLRKRPDFIGQCYQYGQKLGELIEYEQVNRL
ncbi:flavodoxin family protein [candidate division KSB1 bacterium]|nr:flavodoxin family protein [candidate division KSB1 bacterium]